MLLNFGELLQDQQVGLTKAPFKLLFMSWTSEHMRFFGVPFKSGVSVSYSPWVSQKYALLPSKPNVLWAHLPSAGPPGGPIWGSDPSPLGENLCHGNNPPICGLPTQGCGSHLYHLHPSYPSCGSFFIISFVEDRFYNSLSSDLSHQ